MTFHYLRNEAVILQYKRTAMVIEQISLTVSGKKGLQRRVVEVVVTWMLQYFLPDHTRRRKSPGKRYERSSIMLLPLGRGHQGKVRDHCFHKPLQVDRVQ